MARQKLPHHYAAAATTSAEGDVTLESERLRPLPSAPPMQFGGPGDRWSPETLLVGAVADCFVLTFRAMAGAARFPWISLACQATGTVDRVDRVTQFTEMYVTARLRLPTGGDEDRALRLLNRAEEACLAFFGSTTQPVVREAACPVLTLRTG